MGHYQALPAGPMDNHTTITANAIRPDVLEFLPGDTAGRAASLEQTLPIEDQRFRPVGQHQGDQEKSETEGRPA